MQRTRLLGPGLVALLACTLTLAACNSSSVSGTQPAVSKTSNAEAKPASAQPNGPQLGGLIEAAASKVK